MSKPYIQLMRGYKAEDLIECHPNAFLLLSIIALRARRTPNLIKNLDTCECHIGDYKKYGLTEQKYRTAKRTLEKLGLVTFCATNKGTVAKIINSDIYNINADAGNEQDNGKGNGKATTNKNDKKVYPDEIKNFTASFQKHISKEKPTKAPDVDDKLLNNCNDTIDKLIRLDGFELNYIIDSLRWAVKDDFWSSQIFSLASLRTKSKNGLKKFQNLSNAYDNSLPEKPKEKIYLA